MIQSYSLFIGSKTTPLPSTKLVDGNFALDVGGEITASVGADNCLGADNDALKTALEALPNVGAGNATVTKISRNEKHVINLNGATTGQFYYLAFDGHITAIITVFTAAGIKAAIDTSYGTPDQVIVTDLGDGLFQVEYVDNLASTTIGEPTIYDDTTGAGVTVSVTEGGGTDLGVLIELDVDDPLGPILVVEDGYSVTQDASRASNATLQTGVVATLARTQEANSVDEPQIDTITVGPISEGSITIDGQELAFDADASTLTFANFTGSGTPASGSITLTGIDNEPHDSVAVAGRHHKVSSWFEDEPTGGQWGLTVNGIDTTPIDWNASGIDLYDSFAPTGLAIETVLGSNVVGDPFIIETSLDANAADVTITFKNYGLKKSVALEMVSPEGGTPTIASVEPPGNGTYSYGDNIDFVFTFSEPVEFIPGDLGGAYLTLVLDTYGGGVAVAALINGSGTNTLTFRYGVNAGDFDDTGIEVQSPLILQGTLKSVASGCDAVLDFTPPNLSGVMFNALNQPTVVSVTPPADGDYVDDDDMDFVVQFSEAVNVTGSGSLTLRIGVQYGGDSGNEVRAGLVSGDGTDTLTFRYTVEDGVIDANGINVVSPVWAEDVEVRAVSNNAAADLSFSPPGTSGVTINKDEVPPTPPNSSFFIQIGL